MSDDHTIDEQIRQRWGIEPMDGDIINVDENGVVTTFHRPGGLEKESPNDFVSVPLVVYVDGERVVLNEVPLKAADVHEVLGIPHVATDVVDYLFANPNAEFALGKFFSAFTRKPSKDQPPLF